MRSASRIVTVFFALAAVFLPLSAWGQTADDLQKQIDDHNAQIAALNKEIAQYQTQLDAVSEKKQTLQNTLSQLDISRKKIAASISVTKNQIGSTQLQIQQLSRGIASKEDSIQTESAALGESLRRLDEMETETLVVQVLTSDTISTVWQDIDAMQRLQAAVQDHNRILATEKKTLTETKNAQEQKRAQLLAQQRTLVSQQGSLDATRKTQSELLAQTKAQESTFQAILAQKKAQEAEFENALSDLQSQLQQTLDTSSIAPAKKGILSWPLDSVKVTQYFGDTSFARSGGYNRKGPNGIDLRASIGTPIKAALTGVIVGTGDTGSVRGCYSYGRWVLIQHSNGLDTLYAHLSQISVSKGQPIGTGQIIGYSGQTGYATGPHLHFGVFASTATQVMRLGDATKLKTPCSNAVMPIVAPLSGYLDPMSYL